MSASSIDLIDTAAGEQYPLLFDATASRNFAWRAEGAISCATFLADVHRLRERLPDAEYVINLCADRYNFLVGFAAALSAQRTTLLPPSRAQQAIDEIAISYPGVYCLRDGDVQRATAQTFAQERLSELTSVPELRVPMIASQHLAAIVFTSGSTGHARPNLKYWGDLVLGARMIQQRFGTGLHEHAVSIVATVPPQHMYGLETSVLNPLVNGDSIYTSHTFFPADICSALHSIPSARILVTTPFHLQACLGADLEWPQLQAVISATAPLSTKLAQQAEHKFNCPVREIYGCTEAGTMASRRTLDGDAWWLFGGAHLRPTSEGYSLNGPHLRAEVPLHDLLELIDHQRFRLLGRHTDMINIAGKRASLADLNIRLQEIDGVIDGVYFNPNNNQAGVTRLAAFVVSESLDVSAIRKALAARVDPVFLPRPLYLVDKLPRNPTGKLSCAALATLLDEMRHRQ